MDQNEIHSVSEMKEGPFTGHDSLELLHEAAAWVENRICAAITRAGFSPDAERNAVTFAPRPASSSVAATLLSGKED
jgi:hypothetical protein